MHLPSDRLLVSVQRSNMVSRILRTVGAVEKERRLSVPLIEDIDEVCSITRQPKCTACAGTMEETTNPLKSYMAHRGK